MYGCVFSVMASEQGGKGGFLRFAAEWKMQKGCGRKWEVAANGIEEETNAVELRHRSRSRSGLSRLA
jgi:hypothetical protein